MMKIQNTTSEKLSENETILKTAFQHNGYVKFDYLRTHLNPKSFLNRFYSFINLPLLIGIPSMVATTDPIKSKSAIHSQDLRAWWHNSIRKYGHFRCYAAFLALPSDTETIRYIVDFRKELELLSKDNCLIFIFDKLATSYSISPRDWEILVKESYEQGYNLEIARLFSIEYSEFPCLLFFKNLKDTECIKISIKDMQALELSRTIRVAFSEIDKAIIERKNPIEALHNYYNTKERSIKHKKVAAKLINVADRTFEKIIEAMIQSTIKSP